MPTPRRLPRPFGLLTLRSSRNRSQSPGGRAPVRTPIPAADGPPVAHSSQGSRDGELRGVPFTKALIPSGGPPSWPHHPRSPRPDTMMPGRRFPQPPPLGLPPFCQVALAVPASPIFRGPRRLPHVCCMLSRWNKNHSASFGRCRCAAPSPRVGRFIQNAGPKPGQPPLPTHALLRPLRHDLILSPSRREDRTLWAGGLSWGMRALVQSWGTTCSLGAWMEVILGCSLSQSLAWTNKVRPGASEHSLPRPRSEAGDEEPGRGRGGCLPFRVPSPRHRSLQQNMKTPTLTFAPGLRDAEGWHLFFIVAYFFKSIFVCSS